MRATPILAFLISVIGLSCSSPSRIFRCGLTVFLIGWLMSYRASTRPRTDLPPSAQACVTAAGETHVHVTWRNPDYFPLRAVAAERWELALNDAPVGQRLSLLIHDGNACDANPTGTATRNVYVNDVLLTQIVTVTTGSGAEPGLAFSVDASGRVTP